MEQKHVKHEKGLIAAYLEFITSSVLSIVFTEAMSIAQQVLALDTRYNACRTLPRQTREIHMCYLSMYSYYGGARYVISATTQSAASRECNPQQWRSSCET